jgi:hypothetical protein
MSLSTQYPHVDKVCAFPPAVENFVRSGAGTRQRTAGSFPAQFDQFRRNA